MKHVSESIIITILFLVQFIDVLDFMVVMPLSPDFSKAFGISTSKLGWIASSYTFAAAFSGILSSTIIDRFERKKILIFTLIGLVIANICSANAWSFESLLASRFLAGSFGGPATSLCFAIIADLFEEKERGKIMGKVMSGFSIAAIFGVPIGLNMSLYFGWHSSFYTVAALGIITIILIVIYFPKIDSHLSNPQSQGVTYLSLFNKPINLLAFLAVALGSMAAFMIIPYISPFLQANLNFPRTSIDHIYFLGGVGSFFAMRMAGKLVDSTSSSIATIFANIFILFSLIFGFIFISTSIPILIIFAPFMIGMAMRNVSNYTLYSKVPALHERAGFMSVISCIQHLASAFGAILTSLILVNEIDGQLKYMDIVAILAAMAFMIAPWIMIKIERLNVLKNQA